jgi:hypothetical protein
MLTIRFLRAAGLALPPPEAAEDVRFAAVAGAVAGGYKPATVLH